VKFFEEVGFAVFREEWQSVRERIMQMVSRYVENLLSSSATFSSTDAYSVGSVDTENPSRRVHVFLKNEDLLENSLAITLNNGSVAVGYVFKKE
jgi:hypothetical protein